MPPRYAYWTILAGGLPTAFRTTTREQLLPTFRQIRQQHPDAVMRWFARGKLWESPEEARAVQAAAKQAMKQGQGGARVRKRAEGVLGEGRSRDWRPGGDHRDPRQDFKDAKKAKNQRRRKQRWERKAGEEGRVSTRGLVEGRSARPGGRGKNQSAAQGLQPSHPVGTPRSPRGKAGSSRAVPRRPRRKP